MAVKYPNTVINKILKITMQTESFAYLAIDEQGRLTHQGGNIEQIGLPRWEIGNTIIDEALFLTGIFPMNSDYELIPSIQLSDSIVTDIHLFKEEELSWIILVDKTSSLEWQKQARQKSNELNLLKQSLNTSKNLNVNELKGKSEFDFFEALNMMAFLVTNQYDFELLKPLSKDFYPFYPEAFNSNIELMPHVKFPFIDNFLVDAQKLWDKKINQQKIDSGPWVEQTDKNGSVVLEAIAIFWEGHQLLLIEIINKNHQKHHEILQRARENVLIKNRLEKELVLQSSEIHYLATHDILTRLPNRYSLFQRLAMLISNSIRHEKKFALLFLDIDAFKEVNDSLGHDAGDELLKVIAKRLEKVLRDGDFAARLGGDEFCLILEDISDDYPLEYIAERCLESVSQPTLIAGRTISPQISIGITIYPDDGTTPESLLSAADIAMYSAKRAGKHQFSFYTPEMTKIVAERMLLESELRNAIHNGQLELHYQPQISVKTGRIVGVEALIRWLHPQRGLVSPSEFIHVAERIGFIFELGEWVINTACEQAMAWQQSGIYPFKMAINISGSHFQQKDGGIVNFVTSTLQRTGLDPKWLELEVTEDVVQITGKSIETLNTLKNLGVTIAIDDFGTGYSSLGSLKHLPIDCLKVDRVFIVDALSDQSNSVIIEAVIAMGRALDLLVLVEGVETIEQVEYLNGVGCDLIQGFYFSKPVLPSQIKELTKLDFMK